MALLSGSSIGLESFGIGPVAGADINLSAAALFEEAVRRGEGSVAAAGPIVVNTGKHTGRSPQDKFFVKEPGSEAHIDWGKTNKAFGRERFDALLGRVDAYLRDQHVFVTDAFAGADIDYRLPVRVITTQAWHALFARHLFIDPAPGELRRFRPEFAVVDAADFLASPERDGTRSETFIIIDFSRRVVLIGGTTYAGEIKKSVFTLMNYLLPLRDVMPMHCSANVGKAGDVAVFFGLSGTGKTTLSADPDRALIGDDEHGWSDAGVFNFEGGCYAKVINLSAELEPQIFPTTRTFGTVLENVVIDPATRELDLADASLTENTRAAYPLSYVPNTVPSGRGGHPQHIVMLTCDAFGVLPPIAKMTVPQAMYHFLSGYTARVAGTEKGVTEPQATFSHCFGAPFMVHPPMRYAQLLGERIAKHEVDCWLVNTGWSGGPYGVGGRMKLPYTRAMIKAALSGQLADARFTPDPIFNVSIPDRVPGVPAELLDPRSTWHDRAAYDTKAAELARLFADNFTRFASAATPEVAAAAPKVG
ncbi:MAG: phosphoenolpyruvate carboxykinase (ATP) [Candidatus Eremiobacteraeota bacterium]|nr:phosphoenolpyruvate carboxykinase (ATP) [Candidatus Eremiobacteraeota bacterium]MBV8366603.1 phosphoenolpyruvate carboxykinase (ATP) [Candidatus Eremiobacteraeota bacterium]